MTTKEKVDNTGGKTGQKKIADVVPGGNDPAVQDAIMMIAKDSVIHNNYEGIWRTIQLLFEAGFTVQDPTGTKKISSKLLQQVLWKVVYKMKMPDFKLYKAGPFALHKNPKDASHDAMIREQAEQIVTAGVTTVMKEGRFLDCLSNKGGTFMQTALFGDSHVHVGYDEDNSDYPITFRVASLSDVYINVNATNIRDPVGGNGAEAVVAIYRYTMGQFEQLYPDWEGKVAPGEIPRSNRFRKQLEKTWLQTTYQQDDGIEVAHATNINGTHVVFAGSACTVIEKLDGKEGEDKEFPYLMDGKPYLPLLHFMFFPSSEGYYNYGIGHMLYDLAVLTARMDNMAYNHAGDNIWPIAFVNSPNKGKSKLFNEILKAHEMRAAGGKGYVISENPAGQGSGVTLEEFKTQPITEEWERAFHRLETMVERFGFKLDLPDLGANPNEMAIMASQEATDAPIKQIIEFNGSEFEMAIKMTMEAMRKFISIDDETPINSMVDIVTPNTKMPMRGIPLGWVAEELRQNRYFAIVNYKDGVVQSNIMERAKINQAQAGTIPGSPAFNKMQVAKAQLNGQNITVEDLQGPPPPAVPGQAPGGPASQPIPTETTPANAVSLKHPGL